MNCRVRYLPMDVVVTAQAGDTLLDAALDHGIELPHDCGGNCACTTCQVSVGEGMENLSPMEEAEADRLTTAENRTPASRLSCQALLRGGAVAVTLAGHDGTGM